MPEPTDAAAPGLRTEGERPNSDLAGPVPSVSAEQVAVGALVQAAHGLRVAALDVVADDDFRDPLCVFTVRTVRRMVAEGVPVDPVVLVQFVARHNLMREAGIRCYYSVWLADLTTASAVPVPGNVLWYCRAVVEQSTRLQIEEAAQEVVRVAGTGSVAEVSSVVGSEMTAMVAALGRLRGVLADA